MKIIKYLIGSWVWFILLNGWCYALDRATVHPGIYQDTWHSEYNLLEGILDEKYTMTIDIGPEGISWEINGKTLESVKYEYLYSKLPASRPFLCLYTQDGDDEHVFCGIIYETVPFNKLIGVYEYSTRQINPRLGKTGEKWMVGVEMEFFGVSEGR